MSSRALRARSIGTAHQPPAPCLTSRFKKRSTARWWIGWRRSRMRTMRRPYRRPNDPDDGSIHYARREIMRGAVLYGPGDVRFEERDDPKILEPTDAIIRIPATCVCGSDLWPFRGVDTFTHPQPMGHEYCGVVEEVGK